MTKYQATATIDWGRLAGDDDDADDVDKSGNPIPTPPPAVTAQAGAAVAVSDGAADPSSSVSWHMPIGDATVKITIDASGKSHAAAAQTAAAIAHQVQEGLRMRAAELAHRVRSGDNAQRLVASVVSALVPPQARAAVAAARTVVRAFHAGHLRGIFHRLSGGARAIAAGLLKA